MLINLLDEMGLCSLQGFKGTVVNYACQLLNKGSLEITCPLHSPCKYKYTCYGRVSPYKVISGNCMFSRHLKYLHIFDLKTKN